VPPLAVSIPDAAALLSVSENHFRRVVLPHVQLVQLGAAPRVVVASLSAFLEGAAAEAPATPQRARVRAPKETPEQRLARFNRRSSC
jgi:hypothetical protein